METPPEASGREAQDNGLDERKAILQNLFRGQVSTQLAAENLASISSKDLDMEKSFLLTWVSILGYAKEASDHHEQLSELLVSISRLPPAKDGEGKQRTLYSLRIWDDLPGFAIELHEDWRYYAHRQTHVITFVNVNKFAAQLYRTPHSIFTDSRSFRIWALWLMRGALEYPGNHREELEPLKNYLPAALAWLSILGPEIFSWDNEFPNVHREGDPGRGGPLWNGQHGFCKERWKLWKQRFVELSSSDELDKELREVAAEGAAKMDEAATLAAEM